MLLLIEKLYEHWDKRGELFRLPGDCWYLVNGHRAVLSCVVFITNARTIDAFTVKRAVIWT